jgi:5,10-methylenetetrahydromethanopterin reductase
LFDLSISSDGRDAPAAFFGKIATGTQSGRRRIWIANHLFQRDPVTLAASALARDPHIDVALMAMSPFTMHPAQLAMAAATLDELYPGRITLCLGVGAPVDLGSVGLDVEKPLAPMRETIRMIRALLSGETVTAQGETFRIERRKLVNGGTAVPVVLAASGPKMLEMAGAEADGVLISAATSIEFMRWCQQHVDAGARGRQVRRIGLLYGSVADDPRVAHQRLRRMLAITLRGRHHGLNLQLAGNTLDQEALTAAVAAENWPAALEMITDRVVTTHAASGTPADVAARFAAYRQAGLDELVLSGITDSQQLASLISAADAAVKGDL